MQKMSFSLVVNHLTIFFQIIAILLFKNLNHIILFTILNLNTYMELHLGVIVIVVHTEDLVVGQYVEQLPLSLVHEDTLVLL